MQLHSIKKVFVDGGVLLTSSIFLATNCHCFCVTALGVWTIFLSLCVCVCTISFISLCETACSAVFFFPLQPSSRSLQALAFHCSYNLLEPYCQGALSSTCTHLWPTIHTETPNCMDTYSTCITTCASHNKHINNSILITTFKTLILIIYFTYQHTLTHSLYTEGQQNREKMVSICIFLVGCIFLVC